jgi:hypothetical protein
MTRPVGTDPSAENLSQQAHRQLIGYLGLLLPFLLYGVAGLRHTGGLVPWRLLSSISAYYYTGAVAVFVGVLFALALFLLTYRGYKGVIADRVLGLIGGTAAIFVALFPTFAPQPVVPPSWWYPGMAKIHYVSAVALFVSFILFAIWLFRKSNVPRRADRPPDKRRRDDICLACGIVMIVSVLWAASAMFTHAPIVVPESIAIIAFAISWLTKGEAHKPVMSMIRTLRQKMNTPTVAALVTIALASRLSTPSVEQTTQGRRPSAALVASFDGLGVGLQGPHGRYEARNPSDNSLAVGPDYVFQIVNTRMAIFRKNGEIVYGPVPTNTLFKGFGGACEAHNNGDAVVRYDQLANRWLVVMPVFTRSAERPDQPGAWQAQANGGAAYTSPPGVAGQPGAAAPLFVPPAIPPGPPEPPPSDTARRFRQRPPEEKGPYSMCYAVSTSPDPLGSYYRYEFLRPLFPDYPRPAVWPDGYYVPTSTGDEVIQKHACVADRAHMLRGEPATEQCVIIDGVNFLNTSDLDGSVPPPTGAPNVILAAGGTQLHGVFDDSAIYAWQLSVNWSDSSKTRLMGPQKIAVAPYHYLCDGQLTTCVRQPGTDQHLDAQGDKLMARVVYRNLNGRESIVAVHSVATRAGGGGVRWYEFTVSPSDRALRLRQQGTYAPDSFYRWMASPAIDRDGNIGIGYSFGGSPNFAGQRFAGRLANDPLGTLTVHETVLAEGAAPQTNTMRWEDYTQTALDPADDCTIWYVGDYLKKDAWAYSTRIGAFRLCR